MIGPKGPFAGEHEFKVAAEFEYGGFGSVCWRFAIIVRHIVGQIPVPGGVGVAGGPGGTVGGAVGGGVGAGHGGIAVVPIY